MPLRRATLNCVGVSSFFHSASVFSTLASILDPDPVNQRQLPTARRAASFSGRTVNPLAETATA